MTTPIVRHTCRLARASLLLVLLVLTGCGAERAADQQPGSDDELGAHGGEVCPTTLPRPADPGSGLGTEEPAETLPSLGQPESAWVCRYDPVDDGAGPGGDGTTWAWERAGAVQPVQSADLEQLGRHLDGLAAPESERSCTADLGPRWMLVYAIEQDLTGVVVDDYGCRDVRLSDDPFDNPPGEATQAGTVTGVLAAPEGLLADLKAVAEQE